MDKLGPYELNNIITGDARDLAKDIPDESIDLIFTDPVYDRINDYEWLAETAARVLKPDRACLVWGMTSNFNLWFESLSRHLLYRWLFFVFRTGFGSGGVPINGLINKHTVCVWIEKGRSKTIKTIWDVSVGVTKRNGSNHKWSKDPVAVTRWLYAFTDTESIIFDPFTGGGTVPAVCKMLNRQYLAFEICKETANLARERVRLTQPPLPGLVFDQLEIELK